MAQSKPQKIERDTSPNVKMQVSKAEFDCEFVLWIMRRHGGLKVGSWDASINQRENVEEGVLTSFVVKRSQSDLEIQKIPVSYNGN